jgi:hypothetical protein
MKAIEKRCTTHEYTDREMRLFTISNVLWAANKLIGP